MWGNFSEIFQYLAWIAMAAYAMLHFFANDHPLADFCSF